jgi:hypothetical protein
VFWCGVLLAQLSPLTVTKSNSYQAQPALLFLLASYDETDIKLQYDINFVNGMLIDTVIAGDLLFDFMEALLWHKLTRALENCSHSGYQTIYTDN